MDAESMQEAARAVKAHIPDDHGFILLVAPFSDNKGGSDRLVYVSNVQRECAIAMLKEFLIRAGAEEDWMKHIK